MPPDDGTREGERPEKLVAPPAGDRRPRAAWRRDLCGAAGVPPPEPEGYRRGAERNPSQLPGVRVRLDDLVLLHSDLLRSSWNHLCGSQGDLWTGGIRLALRLFTVA